ncbi:MAG: FAD-dependent oxidoreductase [Chloroflexi bacterium]|nr:FAD-dependent oxidoreductase [Chloroflexota bacterium]
MLSGTLQSTLNRRRFLSAGAGFIAAGLTGFGQGVATARSPLHGIIVGAGLSGLCAAYELERRGHSVTLLEAENTYVGGRVRTISFGDGLYGEAGAMRIPADHHLVRHYVAQFQLPLRPFVELNRDAFYFVGGRRRRIRSAGPLDPRYALQGGGGGPGSIWRERFDEIVGGMDRLPRAFLQRVRSPCRNGCRAIRIEQDAPHHRAAVVYMEHGRQRRAEGDFVLCTLPLPVMLGLEVMPSFTDRRLDELKRLHYGAASKTLFLTTRRFWESDDGIYGGASYTDLPTGPVYYPSDNALNEDPRVSAGPGVLLASYTLGHAAVAMDDIPKARRSSRVRELLTPLHPQLEQPGMVTTAVSWSWEHHPFSLGAFAVPGQDSALVRRIRSRHGQLFFAGEHTSSHPTWMEGALESALRAVREILGG